RALDRRSFPTRRSSDLLLHLVRVLLVEAKDYEQSAEEKDLGHQRLDNAALVSGDERDHQHQDDEDVDDHRSGAILDDGPWNSLLRDPQGQDHHIRLDSERSWPERSP